MPPPIFPLPFVFVCVSHRLNEATNVLERSFVKRGLSLCKVIGKRNYPGIARTPNDVGSVQVRQNDIRIAATIWIDRSQQKIFGLFIIYLERSMLLTAFKTDCVVR